MISVTRVMTVVRVTVMVHTIEVTRVPAMTVVTDMVRGTDITDVINVTRVTRVRRVTAIFTGPARPTVELISTRAHTANLRGVHAVTGGSVSNGCHDVHRPIAAALTPSSVVDARSRRPGLCSHPDRRELHAM